MNYYHRMNVVHSMINIQHLKESINEKIKFLVKIVVHDE